MTQHIVNISGGKDSTVCYLLAVARGRPFRAVMADTGHESQITMDYVRELPRLTGGPEVEMIRADFTERLAAKRAYVDLHWRAEGVDESIVVAAIEALQPTGIPFLDLCLWKGRFPSARAQFCTEHLKVIPIYDQVIAPALEVQPVVQWLGVRRAESKRRSTATRFQRVRHDDRHDMALFRPIVHWSAGNVFTLHKHMGVPPNPLYLQGMARVGCFPCIHSQKDEIRAIAVRFPEVIDKLAQWERIVAQASKHGAATFFHAHITPEGRAASARGETGRPGGFQYPNAQAVADWSRTGKGGRNFDIERWLDEFDDAASCSSHYGLCE